MSWYILQAQGNREKTVAEALNQLKEKKAVVFEQVLVPEENVIENSISGVKKTVKRRLFPGYIFFEGEITDEIILALKDIRFTSGFIGGNKPAEMSAVEAEKMLRKTADGNSDRASYKISFTVGEEVELNNGPFEGFSGHIEDCDYDRNSLKISIAVFGRDTDIDVSFDDVTKLN
jgi:transcriptional antiterminator NusG